MQYLKYFLIAFAVWNLVVFAVYGIDKYRAKKEKWRISEKTLILLALFFGGTGALFGMGVFHHKTLHKKFSIGVPLLALLNYVMIGAGLWLLTK